MAPLPTGVLKKDNHLRPFLATLSEAVPYPRSPMSSVLLSPCRAVHRLPVLRYLALAVLLAAVPSLHASTITYDVALTPTSGQYGGSGTLTLASAPSASGISTFSQANGQLQGLSFTIDNQTFSL